MINTPCTAWSSFDAVPVIGILRNLSATNCEKVAEVMAETGFRTLEVTMNTPRAEHIIDRLVRDYPDLNVGAGTVCTMEDLDRALAVGAGFIVTPILEERVIGRCADENIPVFPGAYTPTEIYRAWNLGASAVKVFPASQLGVNYLQDLRGPLPQIKLLPTGGVTPDNIAAFLAAGAYGVGMGSSLLPKDLIERADFDGLRAHLRRVRARLPTPQTRE
ncbi:bifunctional 4-hydroxy-2-oxoglutarate aldolase/2-dehydro-3-deoxy-phosphogluconate aldolase [Lewinella sp. JB7]|uniref:bifunctional 4-hydroxy-2-oxoglutarate aldolase/2-dehydro-3-deoxy-phosphogluconate aldolase n=1 Tax=Lewinella sp. JB7 TaxID=2962887 RepID=UPI0020C9DC91|nr:bifunctional 4-hydroxy-2-oxoglutarate aldolase/2-dehydro-3-deoxy-phosphogluconate aldolase [Lewinella sp. JB7]MCP9235242.1 bifunctional 4-hydroxy-2-oxoglutarate aldolase/2-dehydro-3-deoxy-phosphogluconate aldolase [Lewinella sp. JB7]